MYARFLDLLTTSNHLSAKIITPNNIFMMMLTRWVKSDILFKSGAHFNKKHWNLFTISSFCGFDKRLLPVLTGVKNKIIIRKCFWKISKRAPILQLRNHPSNFSCLFCTTRMVWDALSREKFVLKKKARFILIYIRWKIRQQRVFLGTRWKKEHVWYFGDKVFSFFFLLSTCHHQLPMMFNW